MEQWAEIRRLHFVGSLGIREIHRRTGPAPGHAWVASHRLAAVLDPPVIAIEAQLDALLVQDKVGSRLSRHDAPPAPSHPLPPTRLHRHPRGKTTACEIRSRQKAPHTFAPTGAFGVVCSGMRLLKAANDTEVAPVSLGGAA
jgi:hypothetical protein